MLNLKKIETLRLLIPQWQGGNRSSYPLGARLLEWLAPKSNSPTIEIPIKPYDFTDIKVENGIVERHAVTEQLQLTQKAIATYQPKKVVTFGGDCLVSQAPFDYLNGMYGDKLGILWLDAHPDVMTPNEYHHSHAMVLGNLMGEGDPELARLVSNPINPENVMYVGLQKLSMQETKVIERLNIHHIDTLGLGNNNEVMIDWIQKKGFKYLAVHLDFDILNAKFFNSLLFNDPNQVNNEFEGVSQGNMDMSKLISVIQDISKTAEIVGLTFAEYMPWDVIALDSLLQSIPILHE